MHPPSYTSYIDLLGFKVITDSGERIAFLDQVKGHVDFSCYKFLRKSDNGSAFRVMVKEFLTEHGSTFWGGVNRSHLKEPDISKRFFCPRDANRKGSR